MEKTKNDMRHSTKARVDFYVSEIREKDNEWILEELHEWGDYVNSVYYAMWKNDIITQQDYQEIVAIARDGWTKLVEEIREYESGRRRNPYRVGLKGLHALVSRLRKVCGL